MAARKKYDKKLFESTQASSDTSANIYESMLLSDAWQDLTPRQQILYVHMKSQYYSEKRKPDGDRTCFTFNQAKWRDKYHLYTDANKKAFYTDRDALILHGFIRCTYDGKSQQRKTEYQYSDKWRFWGQPTFSLSQADMPQSLKAKLKAG
ncbi:hypothetical protein LJC60_05310 [Ruminococcaceae bacterium OttesenSCG-928-D13]|nr:hypothetical protein [Ruminococcaceae bacterium OttesenSCG-928-D13]